MSDYKTYELSEAQLKRVMDASKSVPAMYLSGGAPMFGTPQENANQAWQAVAGELGCKWDTIGPVAGKPASFITAQPMESRP